MRGDFSLISRHLTQILCSTYPSIMLSELTIYIGNINSLHAGARSLILFPFITNRKPSFTKSLCRYICTYLIQIKTIVYKYLWNLSGLLSKNWHLVVSIRWFFLYRGHQWLSWFSVHGQVVLAPVY